MPISLYAENINHKRTYVEGDLARGFTRIREQARDDEMIWYADPYGDTMFNRRQLWKMTEEIGVIAERVPELAQHVQAVQDLILRILKDVGYLWVSGD